MIDAETLRMRLRGALKDALKGRDRESMSVCRSLLAALDNAEAAPVDVLPAAGAIEQSVVGVGAAEVARHPLTPEQVSAVVATELVERQGAIDVLAGSFPREAATLVREVALIESLTATD